MEDQSIQDTYHNIKVPVPPDPLKIKNIQSYGGKQLPQPLGGKSFLKPLW